MHSLTDLWISGYALFASSLCGIAAFRKALVGILPGRDSPGLRARLAYRRHASGLSLAAGFADEAHLQREFRVLTGVTPLTYRHLAPQFTHHLQVNFIQDRD